MDLLGQDVNCSVFILPESLQRGSAQFVSVDIPRAPGYEDSYYFFMSTDPASSRVLPTKNIGVLFGGQSWQVGGTVQIAKSVSGAIKSFGIVPVLTPQSFGESNGRVKLYLASGRIDFDATVTRQYVAYDGLDCVSSIFAWLSISATLIRYLFPVLPLVARSRYFVWGRGPNLESDADKDVDMSDVRA